MITPESVVAQVRDYTMVLGTFAADRRLAGIIVGITRRPLYNAIRIQLPSHGWSSFSGKSLVTHKHLLRRAVCQLVMAVAPGCRRFSI